MRPSVVRQSGCSRVVVSLNWAFASCPRRKHAVLSCLRLAAVRQCKMTKKKNNGIILVYAAMTTCLLIPRIQPSSLDTYPAGQRAACQDGKAQGVCGVRRNIMLMALRTENQVVALDGCCGRPIIYTEKIMFTGNAKTKQVPLLQQPCRFVRAVLLPLVQPGAVGVRSIGAFVEGLGPGRSHGCRFGTPFQKWFGSS